jgi:hypothetical protein
MVLLCDNVANGGPLAIGPLAGGEQMMVDLLRLRFAAGACVLAAGLLMGAGGAVAVADPGSSGSAAHGKDDTNASGQQHSTGAKKPKDEPGATTSGTGATTSGTGANAPGQQPKKPKDEPGATTSGTGATTSGTGATTSGTGATTFGTGATVTDVVAAVPSLAASVTNVVAPVPNLVAPVSDVIASIQDMPTPVAGAVVPLTQLQSLVQDMLTSVAGAVVPLTQLQSDLYSFLLGIAGVAPVSDVIALVQDMLSSVGGAVVLLAQLPSDLFSFLLGIAGVPPVVGGVAGVHGRGLSAAAGASVASRLPLGLPLAGISGPPLVSGLPVTGEATGVAPLDVIALGRASAVSGMAPVAPDAAVPIGAGSSFRHVFGELLLPVSLWVLAAGVLPGAGGLGFITLAGVRVGYRQAKAGVALRTTGIAHFARPGPLGVVRSGSFVVVRPRGLRVVRPGALSAEHLLDKVA